MWFIYELEQSAISYGGQIHLILGNHEIMVMTNDLRYVALKNSIWQICTKLAINKFIILLVNIGALACNQARALKIDGILFACRDYYGIILEVI